MKTPQTGAEYLRMKKRRKANAERQRALRKLRDKNKQCRTCGLKAAMSKRTGRLARQCKKHLGVDAERKTPKKTHTKPTGKTVARVRTAVARPKSVRVDYRMMEVDGEQVYVSWTRG